MTKPADHDDHRTKTAITKAGAAIGQGQRKGGEGEGVEECEEVGGFRAAATDFRAAGFSAGRARPQPALVGRQAWALWCSGMV